MMILDSGLLFGPPCTLNKTTITLQHSTKIQSTAILYCLWGPLFVGAPVRPNMLNMSTSASVTSLFICNKWIDWPISGTYKIKNH